MAPHECTKENFLGQVEVFMKDFNGIKTFTASIVIAIILQVITFSSLWGRLTEKVNRNEKIIDKICDKLNNIKIAGTAIANEEQDKD